MHAIHPYVVVHTVHLAPLRHRQPRRLLLDVILPSGIPQRYVPPRAYANVVATLAYQEQLSCYYNLHQYCAKYMRS